MFYYSSRIDSRSRNNLNILLSLTKRPSRHQLYSCGVNRILSAIHWISPKCDLGRISTVANVYCALILQTMKRTRSSESNEDIAAKSHIPKREQQLSALTSLRAPVSPPRRNTTIAQPKKNQTPPSSKEQNLTPNLAAIEAGEVEVMDHISIFSSQLRQFTRPLSDSEPIPRLPIPNWINLYRRNERPEGHHFVIHQHDHPVAGPHYDLRLQFSESSSVSWSIMYGLPGDPNSGKLNRNATETRVHCLWVSEMGLRPTLMVLPLLLLLLMMLLISILTESSCRNGFFQNGEFDHLGYRRV